MIREFLSVIRTIGFNSQLANDGFIVVLYVLQYGFSQITCKIEKARTELKEDIYRYGHIFEQCRYCIII